MTAIDLGPRQTEIQRIADITLEFISGQMHGRSIGGQILGDVDEDFLVTYEQGKLGEKVKGTYKGDRFTNQMDKSIEALGSVEINPQNIRTIEGLAETLAHELMHFYLFKNGVVKHCTRQGRYHNKQWAAALDVAGWWEKPVWDKTYGYGLTEFNALGRAFIDEQLQPNSILIEWIASLDPAKEKKEPTRITVMCPFVGCELTANMTMKRYLDGSRLVCEEHGLRMAAKDGEPEVDTAKFLDETRMDVIGLIKHDDGIMIDGN